MKRDNEKPVCSIAKNIEKLEAWFNKRLSPEQKDIYIEALCTISDLAFTEIVRDMIHEFHPSPSHFPTINKVKNQWYNYQQRHKAVTEYVAEKCDYCQDRGFIFFKVLVGELFYENCGRCPRCTNWKRSMNAKTLPVVTKEDLEAKGYEVWPYKLPWETKKPQKNPCSIESLTEKIGERL